VSEELREKVARMVDDYHHTQTYAQSASGWDMLDEDEREGAYDVANAILALLSAPEPAETGEDEPSGREEILEAYADEVRRLDAGEPSVCVRCKRPIQGVIDLYRCAECGLAFHDHCIRAHFTDHRSPAPTAAEPVREAPTPETERLFEAVLYGVRCGRGAVNDAACESIAREVIAALTTPEADET
jgi:hypothetical protein